METFTEIRVFSSLSPYSFDVYQEVRVKLSGSGNFNSIVRYFPQVLHSDEHVVYHSKLLRNKNQYICVVPLCNLDQVVH